MPWKRMLAYMSGDINEGNLTIIDYLLEENQALHRQITKYGRRILLTDEERKTLASKALAMGKDFMNQYVTIVNPDTILKWFRKLVAKKFDGTKNRKTHGRPPVSKEIEALAISIAKENPSWGYDKIMGALNNLGHTISDSTVARILEKNGISLPQTGSRPPRGLNS